MMGGTDSRFFTSSFNIKLQRDSGCASPKGRTYEEKKKTCCTGCCDFVGKFMLNLATCAEFV